MPTRNNRLILAVRNLRVERDSVVILDNVSWRVRGGEHWVVLGANGSGKTSLLRALGGYTMPTAGDIEVLGQRYGTTDWRELRTRIGLVSSAIRQMMHDDEPALETVVSGKHAMIGFWFRSERDEGQPGASDHKRALAVLRQIECAYLATRPWRVLSQGERQRVVIGRALMAEPPLLILDEPCAGLDPVAREHFLQFLQRLGSRRNAPALVLVTHHVEEIVPVFSHVLLLRAGNVMATGVKHEVLTSAQLSRTFNARVRLESLNGRYTIAVAPSPRLVI